MAKLRVGIIGAGGIAAKLHMPDLAKSADFEVALVSGRKESRLKLICQRFEVPRWTTRHEDIIADDSIDAVIIATPHPAHVSWGLKALAAGKHVLMQKPLCGEMAEADAFVAAAEKSERVVLAMPHFAPEIYTLRRMVGEGAIGKVSGAHARTSHGGPEVYYAEIRDFFGERDEDLWFFDAKRAGVGALFDMGVYAVANLVAVLGTVKRVTGFVRTIAKPTDLEDAATLILEFKNGALATAETSWCDPARTWSISIHGTAGKFIAPGRDGAKLTQWTPTSFTREDAPPRAENIASDASPSLHDHFRDCIRGGTQPPLSHVWAARHVTETLLAGLESSRSGRAIDIRSSAER